MTTIRHIQRFYMASPIPFPPKLPLPGTIEKNTKASSVESEESFALLDLVLATFSKFWLILNDVNLLYQSQDNDGISLAFALSKYSKLLRLTDDLPTTLIRRKRTSHFALMFQYVIILSMGI